MKKLFFEAASSVSFEYVIPQQTIEILHSRQVKVMHQRNTSPGVEKNIKRDISIICFNATCLS